MADQLTGAPSDLVYADASCSGGDPLALCAGAIFAFPATWGARLRGAAVGFTLITAVNVVRLGNLSLVAENKALLDLSARLRLASGPDPGRGGVVYGWMGRQGFGAVGPGAAQGDGITGGGVEVASLGGLAGVVLAQAALGVPVDELTHHYVRVTPPQHRRLLRWAECARLTYNWALGIGRRWRCRPAA